MVDYRQKLSSKKVVLIDGDWKHLDSLFLLLNVPIICQEISSLSIGKNYPLFLFLFSIKITNILSKSVTNYKKEFIVILTSTPFPCTEHSSAIKSLCPQHTFFLTNNPPHVNSAPSSASSTSSSSSTSTPTTSTCSCNFIKLYYPTNKCFI